MSGQHRIKRLLALNVVGFVFALTACDKTNSVSDDDTTNNVTNNYITQTVGPSGAVLSVEGAVLRIPAGALPGDVEIRMGTGAESPAPLPEGEATAIFELTPHGQIFAEPVVLELPASGAGAVVYHVEEGGSTWEALDTTAPNGAPRVEIDTFSYFVAVAPSRSASELPIACRDELSGSGADTGTPCSNTTLGDGIPMSQLLSECQADESGACMRCLVGRGCTGDDVSSTYDLIFQEVCGNVESACAPACAGDICPLEG